MDVIDILLAEVKGSVDFFLQYTNLNTGSRGYGLTVDSSKRTQICSIASVGYSLTAWVIAAERGLISGQRAREITRGTLETLWERASHFHGFYAHMLDMDTAQRWKKSEYSTIDTAICLNGVISADAYFRDPEIHDLAQKLLERVDWKWLVFEREGQTLFRMAYNPDRQGDYVDGEPGFISQWDMAGEQKMMYLQAANHIDPQLAVRLYEGFSRDTGFYDGQKIIIIPNGSLYGYHCSEAWLDVRKYIDRDGIDWFQNVRLAALASRSFCLENSSRYTTYHDKSWGLSSGDSPSGYDVFGSTPCMGSPWHNGTVSIWGALASLPFIPEQTLEMVNYLYEGHPETWGPYGFFDAFNLDVDPPWYSSALYGIDKGCSMIMVENYLTGLIWDIYTGSPYIQNALGVLGFQQRTGVTDGSI
jgi:hypothetical protein